MTLAQMELLIYTRQKRERRSQRNEGTVVDLLAFAAQTGG